MTLEQVFMAALGAGFTALGWFARELWTAVQKLKEDLGKLEIRIGTDYIRYDRLQDTMRPVMQALEEIKAVLSHKVDKP